MIFSSRHFHQKTIEGILLYYYETSGWLVSVRFLEEIEDTKKRHFEIIWPLGFALGKQKLDRTLYFDKWARPGWFYKSFKTNNPWQSDCI